MSSDPFAGPRPPFDVQAAITRPPDAPFDPADVIAHGGSLTAESTKGIGTVFRIWLPVADA